MTFETLEGHFSGLQGDASGELIDDIRASRVSPVVPGPGCEAARSLRATFAIRAKSTAAAGISTLGLEATLDGTENYWKPRCRVRPAYAKALDGYRDVGCTTLAFCDEKAEHICGLRFGVLPFFPNKTPLNLAGRIVSSGRVP